MEAAIQRSIIKGFQQFKHEIIQVAKNTIREGFDYHLNLQKREEEVGKREESAKRKFESAERLFQDAKKLRLDANRSWARLAEEIEFRKEEEEYEEYEEDPEGPFSGEEDWKEQNTVIVIEDDEDEMELGGIL